MTRPTHNFAAFSDSRARAAGLRRGFTLVEVMVAIAIALALIVGISQIFAMAQKTTGGGTTMTKFSGVNKSMQSQFRQDFQSINLDSATSPGLVIVSYAAPAFRNADDFAQYRGSLAPPDPREFNNPGPGQAVMKQDVGGIGNAGFNTNYRMHRQDRLCMFERGTFHRQTADSPNLTSQTTTQEAYVWYGHLAVLNDAGIGGWDPTKPDLLPTPASQGYVNPGTPSVVGGLQNSNNLHASQWVLGRQVIALSSSLTGETMYQPNNARLAGPGVPLPLSLFDTTAPVLGSTSSNPQSSTPLFASRYDLCLTTSQLCQQRFLQPNNIPWYQQLSGVQFVESVGGTSDIIADQRYLANVYPTKNPATFTGNQALWLSASSAQTAPVFVRGCSQFIVEFAGDFVKQNQDSTPSNNSFGQVDSSMPGTIAGDGAIDFIPIRDINGKWTRQIRWYGAPRDTMAKDANGNYGAGQDGQVDNAQDYPPAITHDVIPLSMFLLRAGITAPVPFERNAGAFTTLGLPMTRGNDFPMLNNNHLSTIPNHTAPYACAWDATTGAALLPKLIRITVAIDEPNGRLNNEQTYEYIFELPN